MDSPDTVTTHRAEPRFERRTVDGQELRIAVWAGSSADKPPLLLFNGIGSRIELVAPFVEHLDPEREIIALDVPGTGESPATQFPYRLWMIARMVGRLLDQLKIERVDTLGVSWGGTLAQQFALQNPRRCRRLVLAATAAAVEPCDAYAACITRCLDELDTDADMERIAAGVVARLSGPQALPEGLQLARFCQAQVRAATWRRALAAMLGFDRRAALAHIAVPTLLLAGQRDPITPPAVLRAMAVAVKGSALVELPGVGHLPHLEAPDAFDWALLDFLRGAQPARVH